MNGIDISAKADGQSAVVATPIKQRGLQDKHLKYLLVLPAFLVIGLTAIGPLFSALYLAFREWNLSKSSVSVPLWSLTDDGLGNIAYLFDNFARAFADDALRNSIWVTTVFTLASVILTVGVALGVALLLARGTRGRVLVRTLLILPFAMSPALVGVSWRFMVNPQHGLVHAVFKDVWPALASIDWLADPILAFAVLLASDIWHWAPYIAMLLLGGLASVPKESQEAAEIDGASAWQVFRDVTLPSIMPVLMVSAVLKAIFSLKMFDQVFMITNGGPGQATQTMAHYIYFQGFKYYDMGYASAVSYFLVLPMLVLSYLYIRLIFKRF
ncbi:sugar ABC transporter permease [Herbaspirillum sp. ST 5-3]|uniref:carbohydrate ABC transporter permease n=1 Tax=Oxalobacteraceae TaxID=75682 RepID=UPI001B3B4FA7|nr:sugar ABC transporter permease [Herbaspirillum sp. ST 5-3]